MLKINCDDFDFSCLSAAFDGEIDSDCGLSVDITVCGESEILALNRDTRGIESVTDVLSYPALDGIKGKRLEKNDYPFDGDGEGGIFLGSIAICEKRAREQGEEYGHGFMREIFYLATHGVCHLLGYDHMTDADKDEMRKKEERVLDKIKDRF